MPHLPVMEGVPFFEVALRFLKRCARVLYLHYTAKHSNPMPNQNTIRYWMPFDQGQPRHITFSTYAKAIEMLEFYTGAGIRCEFCLAR